MHRNEVNLLDYWNVIKKYRKMIGIIVGMASVVAVIASLLMTKIYRAEAVIMPVSSGGATGALSSLASQFGGFASMLGMSMPTGGAEMEQLIVILNSRTLTENVIKRENLLPVLFADQSDSEQGKNESPVVDRLIMEEAIKAMRNLVTILDEKQMQTISISAEFDSAKVAARVVNAYLTELQDFINANALTTAKRNRIFIEEQLAENISELLEAGKEINAFYHEGHVSPTEAMLDVPIATRAEKGASASSFVGVAEGESEASDVDVLGPEFKAIMAKKAEVERKIVNARKVKDVPQQVYLTYLMMRRELLAKVNALLTTQYEMAKIEEAKKELAFQVIDYAVPPARRYKPKRAQICIMAFLASLFLAIFIAFFREYLRRMRKLSAD